MTAPNGGYLRGRAGALVTLRCRFRQHACSPGGVRGPD